MTGIVYDVSYPGAVDYDTNVGWGYLLGLSASLRSGQRWLAGAVAEATNARETLVLGPGGEWTAVE